jgi:hypothetical protein
VQSPRDQSDRPGPVRHRVGSVVGRTVGGGAGGGEQGVDGRQHLGRLRGLEDDVLDPHTVSVIIRRMGGTHLSRHCCIRTCEWCGAPPERRPSRPVPSADAIEARPAFNEVAS